MNEIGDRVGVICRADKDTIEIFGFGIYAGEEIPPDNVGGLNIGLPNPKLLLDNGDVVFGCESWWGSEKAIKERIKKFKNVVIVNINEKRKEAGSKEVESEE